MPYLQLDLIEEGICPQHATHAVHHLHADGGAALGLQRVIHQVLAIKVDIAAAVGVVLAQRALRVQAAQAPAAVQGRTTSGCWPAPVCMHTASQATPMHALDTNFKHDTDSAQRPSCQHTKSTTPSAKLQPPAPCCHPPFAS